MDFESFQSRYGDLWSDKVAAYVSDSEPALPITETYFNLDFCHLEVTFILIS